ncbi:copper-binding protein [Chitiniphilus purpureus]|uniref:Copper-binding protein n=1 Tax=Chitiniphilus purpureus TaxID=2981137 RepID=A0ABY6DKS3_9NEIS|nr:copper-binding protein [Chitiniphilus sp. CD1]UXY14959.1 copper-binding protein [Chitiniphilus sp. CD1]
MTHLHPIAAVLASLLLLAPALHANEDHSGHATHGEHAAAMALTDGEVRKIDQANGKITLKHGEIRNLDMPGMTMVFTVKDKALLDKVKVGDRIRFKAARAEGKMLVTEIQPAAQ